MSNRFILFRAIPYIFSGVFFKKLYKYLTRKYSDLVYGEHSMPIGNDYFLAKAQIYDDTRDKDFFWIEEDRVLNSFLSYLIDEKSEKINNVIDAPFGTGRFLSHYNKYDLDITALDASIDMINEGKSKYPDSFSKVICTISYVQNISSPNNNYDLFVCFRFLPWVIDFNSVKSSMDEIKRVTKQFAILEFCVGDHNDNNSPVLYEKKTMWNRMNLNQIEKFLENYSFKIVKHERVCAFDDRENPGLTIFLCKKIEG